MKHRFLLAAGAVVVVGAAVGGVVVYTHFLQTELLGGMVLNYFKSMNAPPGTLTTELNPAYQASQAPAGASAAAGAPAAAAGATEADWPSYNKTLTSERFSDLTQINAQNVGGLKALCTYDTHDYTSFQSGLIMVEAALIAHPIQHLLARSGQLPRELAHARGFAAQPAIGGSGRGLPRRRAVPRGR